MRSGSLPAGIRRAVCGISFAPSGGTPCVIRHSRTGAHIFPKGSIENARYQTLVWGAGFDTWFHVFFGSRRGFSGRPGLFSDAAGASGDGGGLFKAVFDSAENRSCRISAGQHFSEDKKLTG